VNHQVIILTNKQTNKRASNVRSKEEYYLVDFYHHSRVLVDKDIIFRDYHELTAPFNAELRFGADSK
jgi:hypothetical protein